MLSKIAKGKRVKGVMSLFLSWTDNRPMRKRLIGHLIKKRTGVSLRWIGERLVMGNDSHVSRLCSRIDDLAHQAQLSNYLKAIETRARQE
jgi:hypothetical protein